MGRRSQEAKTCQKVGLEAISAYYSSDVKMGRRSQEAKTYQKGGLEAICAYYSSDLPGNNNKDHESRWVAAAKKLKLAKKAG